MRIEIHVHSGAHGITLTPELRQHVERRLALALDRVELRIRHVRITLVDANGPRGGIDQRCQLQIELVPLPRLVVLETRDELGAAIDGAIDRAVQTMGRLLGRQREAVRRARAARGGARLALRGLTPAEGPRGGGNVAPQEVPSRPPGSVRSIEPAPVL